MVAESQSIPLENIAKQDISLGTPEVVKNGEDSGKEIQLGISTSTSETIIASTPELKLVDNILNETKKFTDEKIVEASLDKNVQQTKGAVETATGTTLLDPQSEGVSVSLNLP